MFKRRILLIGMTVLVGLALPGATQTTSTEVPAGDVAALLDAVEAANASDGADTIALEGGTYTLSPAADSRVPSSHPSGKAGIPWITSDVTIDGNGAIIERDASLPCNQGDDESSGEFSLLGIRENGALTLNDVTLRGGCNPTAGAIRAQADAHFLRIDNSTFVNNKAGQGGAITAGVRLQITNSAFVDNTATGQAGAIAGSDRVSITNSTFTGNSASTGGALVTANEPVDIEQTTIANNTADSGGGIVSSSLRAQLSVKASIIANNSGGNCSLRIDSVLNATDANLSDDDTCPGFSLANTAPKLGSLGDHGGPTKTVALEAGSPAIDAVDDCSTGTDQRGVSRPQDGDGDGTAACDLGAYELENN